MKYTTLLLDVDDTLLDFLRCEENAFLKTCEEYKIEDAQQIYPRYSQINDNVWKELELGQIERREVVVERFRRLFKELNLSYDPAEFNFNYRQNLSSSLAGEWVCGVSTGEYTAHALCLGNTLTL